MSPATHWFWIASRGAGITALVFASASVSYGLMMGGRMVRGGGADRRVTHEVLALCTMLAIAAHGLLLLGDPFLHPDLADVTVPFASSYETVSTTLGIVAGWMLVALGLGFYLRERIGRRRFSVIHRFTLLAWALGLLHTFLEGTDAGQVWFIALAVVVCAPVLVLLTLRVSRRELPRRGRAPGRMPSGALPG